MQLIVTDQLPALNAHLTDLYEQLNGDLTPLMRSIGALLENSTRERFSTKKAPDGSGWAQLSFGTELGKAHKSDRKNYLKGKKSIDKVRVRGSILVNRGDLMKSITYHATQDSVAVGTDRHYGKYHQAGTIHMVARPFLGLSETDKQGINELTQNYLRELISHG